MARFVRLENKIERIKEEFFIRNRIAEENRPGENRAAIQIQSWFRGCQVRAYLSHLDKHATIIQKTWRGFQARAHFRQMVKAACFIMKMNFYNEMAVRVQRRWRGFYTRKYVHNFYARKRYLEGLMRTNELVRRELGEFAEYQQREREHVAMEREEQENTIQAERLHHLLSTQQRPGVFNSPFRPAPDKMELRLRRAKPRPSRSSPRNRGPLLGSTGTGPFRDPAEVWQQRVCVTEPTLRVQTSPRDLERAQEELHREEWRNRLVDRPFQPFSKAWKDRKYERTVHSTSCFLPLAYGTKHFREERPEQLHGKKPFKTVFTTCHVFDKFGRLYSNAGKIV
ncbi:spermatogenesis-associated protein 17 [Osmerus mordax]|uniref:spermatogenesis-associated protein 17 n=1 Tax=Osmerus mordax TaxID=8014 RepID=UPI00350F979F